jgi:hypothetical protein
MIKSRARRAAWTRLGAVLLWIAVLVGCSAAVTAPAPTSTPLPGSEAADTQQAPEEPAPDRAPGRLVSHPTGSPPAIDGQIESLWEAAEPLSVPLTWGMDGTEHALDVEMRALYDEQALYLLATWPGERPVEAENTVYNQFTVHWRIPEPDAARLDCNIACHTIFADGAGRVAYANAETIPHGGSETLPVAGGWEDGVWTLEWSRPLVNGNPFDLQLADRERAYTFRVKVFARVEGRPDPISQPHQLVFSH